MNERYIHWTLKDFRSIYLIYPLQLWNREKFNISIDRNYSSSGENFMLRPRHHPKHSPVIRKIGKVYITENKSILAYLKQLDQSGENAKSYQSIWKYTEGVTEPKFQLYEYPPFQFRQTERMNHTGKERLKCFIISPIKRIIDYLCSQIFLIDYIDYTHESYKFYSNCNVFIYGLQ